MFLIQAGAAALVLLVDREVQADMALGAVLLG